MGSILNEHDRTNSQKSVVAVRILDPAMGQYGSNRHVAASSATGADGPWRARVASANKRAFQVFPLGHLILYVLPFPEGRRLRPS
jgi:hypothetical protein